MRYNDKYGIVVKIINKFIFDFNTMIIKHNGNLVNAGLHILSPKILKMRVFDNAQRLDLDRDVLKPLIPGGKLFSYTSPEYVKDMGMCFDRFRSVTRKAWK